MYLPILKPLSKSNAIALSTSVAARCANQLMSAVSYRISAILFNSGVKYQDINRLHKLAVCMLSYMDVNMQKKMGESCDRKLLVWKREIEENKSAEMLLKEIQAKQVTRAAVEHSHDDMEVEITVDFLESAIQEYKMFDKDVYEHCKNLVSCVKKDSSDIKEDDLEVAITVLSTKKLPSYKVRIFPGFSLDVMRLLFLFSRNR